MQRSLLEVFDIYSSTFQTILILTQWSQKLWAEFAADWTPIKYYQKVTELSGTDTVESLTRGNRDFLSLKNPKTSQRFSASLPLQQMKTPITYFLRYQCIWSTTGNNGPGGALTMYEEYLAKATQESCLRTEHHPHWSVRTVSECCFEFNTTKLHSCNLPHPFAAHTLKFQELLCASLPDQ